MSRENTYTSIILKKQAYGEADELVTVFTREAGKLRALAKSTKSAKSKLQYGVQVLFLSRLTMTESKLPKIIGTATLRSYPKIREHLEAVNTAFYILEIVLKFTPDEQANERLFDALVEFLSYLDRTAAEPEKIALGLAKLKIHFLDSLGFAIHAEPPAEITEVGFSNSRGGFMFAGDAADYRRLAPASYYLFERLRAGSFAQLSQSGDQGQNVHELQEVLSGFLEYHLERQLKSERFLPA